MPERISVSLFMEDGVICLKPIADCPDEPFTLTESVAVTLSVPVEERQTSDV
jgi:hypothetical protein